MGSAAPQIDTPLRLGRVPFWSQCHQPPFVFHSGRPGFSHGRNAFPPSKLVRRSDVSQMASNACLTFGNVLRVQQKRD
jgi:hypothetical protein